VARISRPGVPPRGVADAPSERPIVRCMARHTAEELENIALIERMQDRRLTASEAAIVLAQAFAIGELSETPDSNVMNRHYVIACLPSQCGQLTWPWSRCQDTK